MCVCTSVHAGVCMCVCVCGAYVCKNTSMCVFLCLYQRLFTCDNSYVCVCVCVYIYIYIYIYINIYSYYKTELFDIEITEHTTFHSWRIYMILCAIPALVAVTGTCAMPESPRFLLQVTYTYIHIFINIYHLRTTLTWFCVYMIRSVCVY